MSFTSRWALTPERVTEPDVVGADIFADLTLHRNGICELRIGFHPFPNSLPGDASKSCRFVESVTSSQIGKDR
jgi:hypothetical protein